MVKIDRPIMIVCTGRSGSTVFYRTIARHRDVGFLSTLNQEFPSQTWLAIFSRLYPLKMLHSMRDVRWFPKPFSPYKFWGRYLPGIARHDRPLFPEDVPEKSIEPLRRTITRVLRLQNKKRFVMKVTGWSRMAYFNRIFPGMRFVYLKRDPRDVVSSWIQAGWLNVTSAVDSNSWEWGKVPEDYIKVWKEMGRSLLLSAAIKTQLDMDDIRRNMALFPGRCFELNYEDFVADPVSHLRETLDFCELQWYEDFEKVIKNTQIHNYAGKWKKVLTEEEGNLLAEFFDRLNRIARTKNRQPVVPQPI